MSEPGTFIGEVQRAARKFWNLQWRWKGPIMAVAALVLIGAIGSIGGSSKANDNKAQPASVSSPSTAAGASEAPQKPTNTPKPTDTPKPTNTPKPTATPAPPTATPEPAGFSFGSGKKLVPTDVQAVTYRTRSASTGCYWERLKGLGGTIGEVIANENTAGPAIVTIAASDVAFNSTRCAKWTQDLSAITASPTAPFKDGQYFVGVDIAPGTWRSDGTGRCYWEREANFGGNLDGIIANDNATGPTLVTISASDKGFKSSLCGTWTKIG